MTSGIYPRIKFNSHYHGGRKKEGYGYILVKSKGHPRQNNHGYVREHILVFQQYHKCCVLKWGNIHHINGIRDDNRIQNLEGCSERQHNFKHRKDMSNRSCLICGSKTTRERNIGGIKPVSEWNRYNNGFICYTCHYKIRNAKKSLLR